MIGLHRPSPRLPCSVWIAYYCGAPAVDLVVRLRCVCVPAVALIDGCVVSELFLLGKYGDYTSTVRCMQHA